MSDTPDALAALATSPDPLPRAVLHVLAMGVSGRTRTWVWQTLDDIGQRRAGGARHTQEQVREAMEGLAAQGWIVEQRIGPNYTRQGYWEVAPTRVTAVLKDLLESHSPALLLRALAQREGLSEGSLLRQAWHFRGAESALAITRLALLAGGGLDTFHALKQACSWGMSWDDVLRVGLLTVLDGALYARLSPEVQAHVLAVDLASRNRQFQPATVLPVSALTARWLDGPMASAAPAPRGPGVDLLQSVRIGPAVLCSLWIDHLVLAGDHAGAQRALQRLAALPGASGVAAALGDIARGAERARAGDWPATRAAYEQGLAALKAHTGQRKSGLVPALTVPYVLALIAAGTADDWRRALKFCLAEAGSRKPAMGDPWGPLAAALRMRLGEEPRRVDVFHPSSTSYRVFPSDHACWLARAWMHEPDDPAVKPARHPEMAEIQRQSDAQAAQALRERLVACGLTGLVEQLDVAVQVAGGQAPPAWFFVPPPQAGWQTALAALAAAVQPAESASGGASAGAATDTRLWWVLSVGPDGELYGITPAEQKRGVRGWGRQREVALSKLTRAEKLPPWDAAVARCIRTGLTQRMLRLDLAAAVAALVGHPLVAWEEDPETVVTLSEGTPEIEVVDLGAQLRVRMQPPPREGASGTRPASWALTTAELREIEALQTVTVMRDGPQHARLIRLTPAQRRVAQLLGKTGLTLPREAAPALQSLLQGLGTHFQVHADEAPAGREVPADPRLRAELQPEGDGYALRLVVAPLGEDGPRLNPGVGRTRLVAAVKGETLGAQRDLDAERAHLEAVLDACPMLGASSGGAVAAWTVDDPELALMLIETLNRLSAVAALDWPKGKPVRVDTAGIGQLGVQVASGQAWLELQGGVQVDETLVASLHQLLDWSGSGRSRFVPLGQGRYLALTEELRTRLQALATVAEPARAAAEGADPAMRVTALAAGWLESTLAGAQVRTDEGFRLRLHQLERARRWTPPLPGTLQATLRPYQIEGYQWALRLAEAGLGAVLADDMGLGKTLQALAVLLQRAPGGAALVVAPTSLAGNWLAEARRFAPALTVHDFAAAADREALVDAAGAGEVVVVSYQLQQIHAAAFARRRWHTLVLDEAQAIKNAAAKRAQAAFDLGADFRLALSGTPVENRLAELWSIMRVCNPGLLGTLAQFNARFAVPIERDRHRGAQRVLRRLVEPFLLRRTRAQVLDDLPPRTELTLRVQGDDTERAHYEALRRQALRDAERALDSGAPGQGHLNVLAQLMRLRRAACDPRLVTPELTAPGAKVQAFAELAAEIVANGHKALVFSQFVDFLALLREPLDAAGIAYQYLDGSTPAAARNERVAAFQGGVGDLFLISLKAGGFGLNLTVADYVIIADPWWNPAAEDQASGRAHRIGQTRPVTVYRLVHQGTLEEKIVALHQDKRELADSVLAAEEENAGGGGAWRADELLELMRAG
ncbi:MAG: SNF2-related protein [Rubrivivax sp.]